MNTPSESPSASELLARIQAIVPLIEKSAERAEADAKPADDVISALEATGVFRSFVPKRFGGFEIDADLFIDIGIAVSEACTSTGWVTTFYMEHNWMFSQFPIETQERIFGQQPYILAPASISPTGKATREDGGYVLSGRWSWGTGVMHADWILLNGIIPGDPPDMRLVLVRRDEIQVDAVWDAAGMQGTGSNDMIATNLFVPEANSEPLLGLSVGRGSGSVAHDSPCYRQPMLPLLTIAAAIPAIGAARRAVQLFKERLSTRTLYGTMSPQAERASAQIRLGHATVRVEEAELILRDVGRRLTEWGQHEEICPPEERARMRLQSGHAVEMCRNVVRDLMEASGAGAHLRSHPMQRIHRDIHTLSCHTVFDLDIGAENYGRLLLGLDPVSPV